MYRIVVFLVFVVAVLADDDMKKCGKLLHPTTMNCCMTNPGPTATPTDDIKECFNGQFNPQSCEIEECIAKKRGYYTAGGGINTEALIPILEKDFEKSPEILTAIKESCLGDVSKFGPPDMCDLMKFRNCLHGLMMGKCGEWNNMGECSGIKELVEECSKMFT